MLQIQLVENIKIHTSYSITFFFSENRAVYEAIQKNVVEPEKSEMTVKHGACVLHAGYLRLQTHT
jgi:hypothetical protein